MLLSSEMYFDVHYDYTTSLRHPWYMSGFVLFRNLKKGRKKKSISPVCTFSMYSRRHHHSTGCRSGLQGSNRESGHLTSYLCTVQKYYCSTLPLCMIISPPTAAWKDKHSDLITHLSVYLKCSLFHSSMLCNSALHGVSV